MEVCIEFTYAFSKAIWYFSKGVTAVKSVVTIGIVKKEKGINTAHLQELELHFSCADFELQASQQSLVSASADLVVEEQ